MTTSEAPLLEPDLAVMPQPGRERRLAVLRGAGEVVLTLGVLLLLFAVYEVVVTGWESGAAQSAAAAQLDRDWQRPQPAAAAGVVPPAPPAGQPELRMYIPALGSDWIRTVLEGVDQDVLAKGPGHYPGAALPGSVGNVAIAGHRVGHGAPFDAAGDLRSCDAIVLETRTTWFVYRLLPFSEERADWARTAARRPECRGVAPLTGAYADVVGREIVAPTATQVIAPVADHPGARAALQMLTITTCHPRFSAHQRMILHAVLSAAYTKADLAPGWRPSELAQG